MHVPRGEVTFLPAGAGMLLPMLALLCACLLPRPVWAEGISGFAEFDHTYVNSTDQQLGALPVKAHTTTLVQRYGISLDRSLYPNLRLAAGAIIEKDSADTTSNGISSSSSSTQTSPFGTLSFGNNFLSAALGYARNELSSQTTFLTAPTSTTEVYTARVGMVPEGLPTLDFRFSRANTFSSNRSLTDNSSDSYGLSSNYRPLQNLELGYQGNYSQSTDRVSSADSESTSQSVTGRYSDRFYDRATVFSTVTLSDLSTSFTTRSGSSGFSVIPLSRLAGFFAVSDNPNVVQLQPAGGSTAPPVVNWTSTPGLIDSDKRVATTPLINLGVPPIIGGDTRLRNIGLDLAVSSTVNTLYLYVNQNLPVSITNQFVWSVYVSNDNVNWAVLPGAVRSVTFESVFDPQSQTQVQRFTILTSDFTTRYLKVVVHPLGQQSPPFPINVDLANILVTEMDAAVRQSFSTLSSTSSHGSSQSGSINSGLRVSLLRDPTLPLVTWDLNVNYNFSRSGSTPLDYNYFVSSGLSAFYKLNDYMSANARLALEYQNGSAGQSQSGVTYSFSVDAHPLNTITSNLTFTGREGEDRGKRASVNSLNLSNTLALYQGIGASFSGGVASSSISGESDSYSTFLSTGLNLVPHQSLNATLNYGGTWSRQSVVGQPDANYNSSTASFQVTYVPLDTVSLFGSVAYTQSPGTSPVVSQNYGGGWSPFRDSALQFNLSVGQTYTTSDNQKTSSISPSLRWNIRPGWWLSSSYAYETVNSTVQETRTNSVTSTLRMSF